MSYLDKEQKQFVTKIYPLSALISEWTQMKSEFANVDSPFGVFSALIMAEIIHKSDWGKHPIAQIKVLNIDGKKKNSNNLTLLEAGEFFKGRMNTYENVNYRAYSGWKDFAVDYSDYLAFNEEYQDTLKQFKLIDQVYEFSLTKTNSEEYNSNIISIIENFSEAFNG